MHRIALLCLGSIACASSGGAVANKGGTLQPSLTLLAAETSVIASAISAVISLLPSDGGAACVTLSGPPPAYWYGPDTALLTKIQSPTRRVVAPGECPPTYDSMVALVDSGGRSRNPIRPTGYVDPHEIIVREQPIIAADSAVVMIDAHQGTLNDNYRCVARRALRGSWVAECRKIRTSISTLPPNESLQRTGERPMLAALAMFVLARS